MIKYSVVKEYDLHIDLLYSQQIKLVLRRLGFMEKNITGEFLIDLTTQARHLSETTSSTMNDSIRSVIAPVKLKREFFLNQRR
jgi:hypothetical protein